jgi:tetratricopeptide (TPR) repeat protein
MKKLFLILTLLLCCSLLTFAQKPDALKLYRDGRNFDAAGQTSQAKAAFQQSVDVCKQELQQNPRNIESYVVLGWSLLRLENYQETIKISQEALKISPKEYRIIETLAEAYFYIDNYTESLKLFEQYVNGLPNGERCATAYFFVGEIYRLTRKYEHADIAYCMALKKEPSVSLWWYRLGRSREDGGNKAGAKKAYEQAIKIKPNYPDASSGLKRVS